MDCPFCGLGMEQARVLTRTANCYFTLSDDPMLNCSGLIIPYRHVPSPFDLTSQEWQETFQLLREAKGYFERFDPDGFNLGWNVGAVAGQDILHAHMHVIARFGDEPLAGRGIRYHLKQPENARR